MFTRPPTDAPILQRQKARKAVAVYLTLVFVASAFLWGYQLGKGQRQTSVFESASGTVEIINAGENRTATQLDFNEFWTVWQTIRERYVRQPIDEKAMFYGAMEGVVASLGDPHSVFLEPKAAEEFTKELSGKFEGIGAEIGIKKNQLLIIAPLPDSPAEKAGLLAGDEILAIDGQDASGLTLDAAVGRIRGDKGTVVKLHIGRKGKDKPLVFEIVRDTIAIRSVRLERTKSPKGKRLAILKVTHFNGDTVNRFLEAVGQAQSEETDGIILDLRNNPGGFLDAAVRMPGEWVPGEIVVSERYSDGSKEEHRSSGRGRLKDLPTVVLVNGGSASASEIVAGALQDYGKAKLIGTQTFGKGSVQDLIDLKYGASLKLTIAEWLTPKGNNINENGIAPDYVVERTEEDYENDRDPQLDAAKAFFDGVIPPIPAAK